MTSATMTTGLGTIAAVVTLALAGGPRPDSPPPGPAETAAMRRLASALGGLDATGFRAFASPRFLLISDLSPDDAALAIERLERTAVAVEQFADEVGVGRPVRGSRLMAVGFAERSAFERFARERDAVDASWMVGYWAPAADRTVFRRALAAPRDEDGATIAHEAAHQLLHHIGVQRRRTSTPLFLAEGLAANFEPCASADGVAFGDAPARSRRLASRRASGPDALPDLASLIGVREVPSRDPEALERFYDASWSLVRFLHATQPDAVARYLASIRSGSTMSEASDRLATFERHFGPLPAVEAAWHGAMRSASGDSDRHERRVRRATADAGASSRRGP